MLTHRDKIDYLYNLQLFQADPGLN